MPGDGLFDLDGRVAIVTGSPAVGMACHVAERDEGGERGAPGFKDLLAGTTLMQRIGAPREMQGVVVYLASDASSYVTGDDLSVSGGMRK